jgi:glutamate racemase
MTTNPNAPIGVFDSGIGGLTVVRELLRQLPNEDLVYFGDTARVPYGPKGAATVTRYSKEITSFLIDQGVKAIVVACNTATAHSLDALRETYNIPIIGVIVPGSHAAARVTKTKRVGVIGTVGTVNSGAYERAIQAADPSIQVVSKACPLFVPLIEEGWLDHPATRLIAEEYLTPLTHANIDALVLGCTHYPLLKPIIRDIMGDGITLIDSAEQTAIETAAMLQQHNLQRIATQDTPSTRRLRFIASDYRDQFLEVGQRFLGEGTPIDRVETIVLGC